jgi:hypothetical protein
MKKVLLSYNERKHTDAVRMVNNDLKTLNNLIEIIKTESKRIAINKENIKSLINDPKGFIFDLVVEKDKLNFNGLPISRKKAMEMIDFPSDFAVIISECEKVKNQFSNKYYTIGEYEIERVSIDDLTLTEEGLVFNDDYLQDLKDEFSIYTSNETQNTAIEHVTLISNSLDELVIIGFINAHRLEEIQLNEIGFKFYGGEKKLDLEQVKRLR